MTRKAQAAIEFVSLVVFLMLIFSYLHSDIMTKRSAVTEYRNAREAVYVSDMLASSINLAFAHGEGYSRNMTTPQDINGHPYDVSLENTTVVIEWNNRSVFSGLVSGEIEGTPPKGRFMLTNTGDHVELSPL